MQIRAGTFSALVCWRRRIKAQTEKERNKTTTANEELFKTAKLLRIVS